MAVDTRLILSKELTPYCETYKNEFAQAVKKGKRSPYSPAYTTHAYKINEIPKLVAQIYNKPTGIDDYHEAQTRLKKLSDEDVGVQKERKAKLCDGRKSQQCGDGGRANSA